LLGNKRDKKSPQMLPTKAAAVDCGKTADLALKHGGVVHRPKWSIGDHGFIAIIGDTEGNAIGLHSFQ
jgi:predicted enzyme related to lactoylglutathione lyase